jgi:hypothetical protein
MRTLVAGWFSFEYMGATAGDLIARDIVCNWLREACIPYDIAVAGPFQIPGGVDWRKVDPSLYTNVIFVCGPFGNGWPITEFLAFFSKSRLIGVNLSLLESLDSWNPFTLLYERDSSVANRPDITFYGSPPSVPVVGVVLAHKQKEYGKRALHEKANSAIDRLLSSRDASIVHIDTALENNKGGLRTPAEVEALIARMDLVVTTRLHGTILALKNGIPVIPIDPISDGAKITQQVKTIEWPVLFNAELLEDKALSDAFAYCLTESARQQAKECTRKAINTIEQTHKLFISQLRLYSKYVCNG